MYISVSLQYASGHSVTPALTLLPQSYLSMNNPRQSCDSQGTVEERAGHGMVEGDSPKDLFRYPLRFRYSRTIR